MTLSEENYIKAIYHLTLTSDGGISTNAIAEKLDTKASSVTDMLKKLADKNWVLYKKYQGVSLTDEGHMAAKMIVRKHRLWEVFLVDKLGFSWDEVHDIAEQLEHIKSDQLIERLAAFLGNPSKDPHGDPIPDQNGIVPVDAKILLSQAGVGMSAVCVGVKDSSSSFLQYLDSNKMALGSEIKVISKVDFDLSMKISVDQKEMVISNKIAANLFVEPI